MSRRPSPDALSAARRAATLERLVSAGVLRDRAEERLRTFQSTHPAPLDWEAAYRAITSQRG